MSITLFGEPQVGSVTALRVGRTRSYRLVKQLVSEWHRTLPLAPAGFRVAFLVYASNMEPVGVGVWGRPEARMEDQVHTLELTRYALSGYAPQNCGSWGLGQMRKWMKVNMPEVVRLISYQDADEHDGALYKADNWVMVDERVGDSHVWTNRAGRLGTQVWHRIKWERRV